jgi:HCO3- transporter family
VAHYQPPSHKISYSTANNYDTVIMGRFTAINSIIGIPWVKSSTVPFLGHYHALAEKDCNGNIVGVSETRLTLFLVHVMVGRCLFVLSVIKVA